MKSFMNLVLLKLFGGFITEQIKLSFGKLELEIKGWKDELQMHREYLNNYTEQNIKFEQGILEKLTPVAVKRVIDSALDEFPKKKLAIRTTNWTDHDRDRKKISASLPCWKEGRPDFQVSYPWNNEYVGYTFWDGKNHASRAEKTTDSISRFITALFETNCVTEIHTENAFNFRVTKPGSITWEEATPIINNAIASLFPDIAPVEANDTSVETT